MYEYKIEREKKNERLKKTVKQIHKLFEKK